MPEKTDHYLSDLGAEVLKLARKAQKDATGSCDAFAKGRQTAFYEVLSLMKQQAEVFELDSKAIGLSGIDLDELLQ